MSSNQDNGNAAELREALELARLYISLGPKAGSRAHVKDGEIVMLFAINVLDEISAALAAPPRQCDVGTAEEQVLRWRGFCACEKGGVCDGCPCLADDGVEACFAKWEQMPYVEKEGGAE